MKIIRYHSFIYRMQCEMHAMRKVFRLWYLNSIVLLTFSNLFQPNSMEESTVFIEAFQGSYNTYLSLRHAHQGWYIGLRKSGKVKKGPKTKYGQKAIKFLPRRSKFEWGFKQKVPNYIFDTILVVLYPWKITTILEYIIAFIVIIRISSYIHTFNKSFFWK